MKLGIASMRIRNERKIFSKEKQKTLKRQKNASSHEKNSMFFELKRKFETGNSLGALKSEIKEALDRGDISIETYANVITELDKDKVQSSVLTTPDFILDPKAFPLSSTALSLYFDKQKLGDNLLVDLGGFVYGFVQGSIFLLSSWTHYSRCSSSPERYISAHSFILDYATILCRFSTFS